MIPPLWLIKAGAVLALLAGAWGHGYLHGTSAVRTRWDAEKASAVAAARTEETRRGLRLQESLDAEFIARQAAQRDAAAAHAAADGLRRAAAGFACLPADSASAPGSSAAAPGPGVLPDVLGELAARADRLAEQADSARIAGQLCERAYEALTR